MKQIVLILSLACSFAVLRAEFNPYGTRPLGALGTSSAQLRIGLG